MSFSLVCLVAAAAGLFVIVTVSVLWCRSIGRARAEGDARVLAERSHKQALLDTPSFGMILLDDQLRVLLCNAVAAERGFRPMATLRDQGQGDAVMPEDEHSQEERKTQTDLAAILHPIRKVVESVLANNRAVYGSEVPFVSRTSNDTAWLRVSGWPVESYGRRQVAVLFSDVTDEKLLRSEMEDAKVEVARLKAEIQSANVAQGQALANMSHALRTPLNGVVGMTGLLLETGLSDRQREFAEAIRKSSEALLVVMNDILDISSIEAQVVVLEDEAFNIQHCVEEAVRLVMPSALKKHLEIICLIDDGLQSVWQGDLGRIRQILINLIGNAVKFTERGEIVVSVGGQASDNGRYRLEFSVRDTGIGIPPDMLTRLTRSVTPLGSVAELRHFGGKGVGLTVSKRLCELMGGDLAIESKGVPGQGCTVRFSVLVKPCPEQNRPSARESFEALADKRVLIVDDNMTSRELLTRCALSWKMRPTAVASGIAALDWLKGAEPFDAVLLDDDMSSMTGLKLAETVRQLPGRGTLYQILLSPSGERVTEGDRSWVNACLAKPVMPCRLFDALVNAFAAPPCHVPLPGKAAHPLRILLAEDNVLNQQVEVELLKKIGYHADVAADGFEAVVAAKQKRYDVILMDVQMPALDGEQATIRIRKELPPDQQPVIVALTANVMKGDRERYLSEGMNDYISKPVRVEQLSEVLQKVVPLVVPALTHTTQNGNA